MNVNDKIEKQIINFLAIEGNEVATADRIYHHMLVNISQGTTLQEVVQRLSYLTKKGLLVIQRNSPKPKRVAYRIPDHMLQEMRGISYSFNE